jgi:putative oxidoreductase
MAKEGLAANWGTLVPRFLLGTVFLHHGGRLLFGLFGGEGPGPLEETIRSFGWPAPAVLARAAAATQFFGGACLAMGLLTRFSAAALAGEMAVAALKVHWARGFSISNHDARGLHGWEYDFVLGILALSLVVQGGGAFSMDDAFFKGKKKPPKPDA